MTPLIKQLEDNPHISVIEFSSQARQKAAEFRNAAVAIFIAIHPVE